MSQFLREPGHKVGCTVIGVNRMASQYPCDWWVFKGVQPFENWPAMGDPTIYCNAGAYQSLWCHADASVRARAISVSGWLIGEELAKRWPSHDVLPWRNAALYRAMMLCEFLGLKRARLFGADFAGELDFDGAAHPCGGRHAARWETERADYERIRDWLRKQGIEVERVAA